MNARSTPSIALYLLLVFVSGILVGAFGYRLYTVAAVSATSGTADSQQGRRQRFIGELKQRLTLRPDQVEQLSAIVDEGHARAKAIHRKIDPEMTALRHEQDGKIRAMLDARQASEFDRWKAEKEKESSRNGR